MSKMYLASNSTKPKLIRPSTAKTA